MIIEDSEKQKELEKIPGIDKNGDPIYKIDGDPSEEMIQDAIEIPVFMQDTPETPQGNEQDIKDSTTED